jgi:hypothetical protein
MLLILQTIHSRVRIATIRDKGDCPCPRCLVLRVNCGNIGMVGDTRTRTSTVRSYARESILRAWDFIYRLGYGVGSAAVERVLKAQSLVPTLVSTNSD